MKKVICMLLFLIISIVNAETLVPVFTDNFGRSDETPIDQPYYKVPGETDDINLTSNTIVSSGNSFYYIDTAISNNQYGKSVYQSGDRVGITLRAQLDSSVINCYWVYALHPDYFVVRKVVDGSSSLIYQTSSISIDPGDTLWAKIINDTISSGINENTYYNGYDATFESGKAGPNLYGGTSSYFECGNVRGACGRYSPKDVTSASLELWLRADTLATASLWQDLSGNGRNFTSGNSTYQPSPSTSPAGTQSMYFDGSDSMWCVDNTWFKNFDGYTIIWRGYNQSTATYGAVFNAYSTTTRMAVYSCYNGAAVMGLRRVDSDGWSGMDLGQGAPQDSASIVCNRHDYTNAYGYMKALILENDDIRTNTDLTVGTSGTLQNTNSTKIIIGYHGWVYDYKYKGYIDELILYDDIITEEERDSLFVYLSYMDISISITGDGTVDTLPVGKNGLFTSGELCTLIAVDGSDQFLTWDLGDSSSTDDTLFLTMTKDYTVTAYFTSDLQCLTPSEISSPTVWLFPDSSSYVSSPYIDTLYDLSGNGNHFWASSDKPVFTAGAYCDSTAFFDGSDRMNELSDQAEWFKGKAGITVIARVSTVSGSADYPTICALRSAGSGSLPVLYKFCCEQDEELRINLRRSWSDASTSFAIAGAAPLGSTIIVSHRHSYASAETWLRSYVVNRDTTYYGYTGSMGTTGGSSTANNLGFELGFLSNYTSTHGFKGGIDEVIIFDRRITDAEEDLIFEYLSVCSYCDNLLPVVDSIRPNPWYYGKTVTWYGSNFGTSQDYGECLHSDTGWGTAESWSDTQVTDTIPSDAYRGKKLSRLINDNGDTAVWAESLNVFRPYAR